MQNQSLANDALANDALANDALDGLADNSQARVTWLLPVKNGMPYLTETLASIEAQTYSNWEILAWDNGSTDGTVEELRRWIPQRLPGRVVADTPLGLGACLAALVEQSQTELCARIDADDVNLPTRLEKQVAFLKAHPQVAVVGTQVLWWLESGENQGVRYPLPTHQHDITLLQMTGGALSHPSVMLRRSRVLEAGNYFDIKPLEDYDLWFRMLSRFRMAALDEPLILYRVRANSVSQEAILSQAHWDAVHACFARYAPLIYGLTQHRARDLVGRQYRCALWPLLRVLRHLSKTQGGTVAARLKSPFFLTSARKMTAPHDLVTRLVLAALEADNSPVREARSLISHAIGKMWKRQEGAK